MSQIYSLSNKAAKTHLLRLLLLLVAGVAMAVAVLYLGMKGWNKSQYIYINIALLLVDVICASVLLIYGGFMDGKSGKTNRSLIILGGTFLAALVVWVVLTIMDAHWTASLPIFFTNLALVAALCYRAFGMLKNIWNDLSSGADGNGETLNFPGKYVLNDVHVSNAITSPMGKVLVGAHSVLFVLVNQYRGHVLVRPNGALEIRKTGLINENKSKEGTLSASELLNNAEWGAQRMLEIVQAEAAKQGVDAPAMGYSFAVFMPNFKRNNFVFNEGAYKDFPWTERVGSYKKYLKKAETSDFFRGRACFNTSELSNLLTMMDMQYAQENPGVQGNPAFVAEAIAQACELAPSK